MNTIVILAKSGFDYADYLSKIQMVKIGYHFVKAIYINDIKGLDFTNCEIHQTARFFTEPDFDMVDYIEKHQPEPDERVRSIMFGKMVMRVHDIDVRIITDHTSVLPVIPMKSEFRYFGSFRIKDITTMFIASGLVCETDKNGVPRLKFLTPYIHVAEEEYERIMKGE